MSIYLADWAYNIDFDEFYFDYESYNQSQADFFQKLSSLIVFSKKIDLDVENFLKQIAIAFFHNYFDFIIERSYMFDSKRYLKLSYEGFGYVLDDFLIKDHKTFLLNYIEKGDYFGSDFSKISKFKDWLNAI